MILTLTLNPAIDSNVNVDRLVFEDRAYILSTDQSAGGRGVNAARVIHSYGGRVTAIVPSGGKTGGAFEKSVRAYGFPVEVVPVQNDLRTNLTIMDQQGLTIKLNELGAALDQKELAQIKQTVEGLLDRAEWLMLCGSLPPGVPTDFYTDLIHTARRRDVRTLLDTDNEALLEGIEAGPTVVTPNQQEAERLLNKALITRGQFLEAAERIHGMGAGTVVLSLGSRGVVSTQGQQILEVRPPQVEALCPIGAGDALAAAYVWATTAGRPYEEALRWGVAAGTATAKLPGMNFATLEDTEKVYRQVESRVGR